MHVPKQFTKKFDARSKKVLLVGYEGDLKNYRLYNPETRCVTVSRNVVFHEVQKKTEIPEPEYESWTFPMENHNADEEELEQIKQVRNVLVEPAAHNVPDTHAVGDEAIGARRNDERQQPPLEPRILRDRKTLRPPARYELNFAEYEAPTSFKEAISGRDSSKWIEAVREELEAHEKNITWTIIPREVEKKTIDSKWVFKMLRDADGQAYRYKARLCQDDSNSEKGSTTWRRSHR